MNWMGLIGGDSTLGSVCSSSSLLGLVDLNVGNNELFEIQLLGLGVVLEILKESQEVSD